jgi:serine phosphatase RsbU (regulator of sigma subunit)
MADPSQFSGKALQESLEQSPREFLASDVLRRCAFFASTADAELEVLAGLTELVSLPRDQTLFEKGDVGTAMYFVLEGRLRVHHGDLVVGRMEAGDVFGEVAALSKEVRSASVTADRDSLLLKLEQQAIYSTLAAEPHAARSLIEALCAREREIIDEKVERVAANLVLERELDIGQRIQQSFLPDRMPEVDGWTVTGLLRPARKVAGDFFDFFVVPETGRLGIVIGDVCDKGVGAALFMTLFRSLLRSGTLHRHAAAGDPAVADPDAVLRHAIGSTNDYIASTHASSSMFASVFFGLLDPATGELRYINAGHEAPVIASASGIRARLETTGPVIGLFENLKHGVETASLRPGEALFGYTDGATDARNEAGSHYSEERLLEVFCNALGRDGKVLEELLSSVDEFAGGADQYDDVTLICVRRHAAPE